MAIFKCHLDKKDLCQFCNIFFDSYILFRIMFVLICLADKRSVKQKNREEIFIFVMFFIMNLWNTYKDEENSTDLLIHLSFVLTFVFYFLHDPITYFTKEGQMSLIFLTFHIFVCLTYIYNFHMIHMIQNPCQIIGQNAYTIYICYIFWIWIEFQNKH